MQLTLSPIEEVLVGRLAPHSALVINLGQPETNSNLKNQRFIPLITKNSKNSPAEAWQH